MKTTHSMRCLRAVVLACLLVPTLAQAELQLSGAAPYQAFRQDLYIAGLFMEQAVQGEEQVLSAAGAKRMDIHVIQARWSARAFAEQWNQSIAINNPPSEVARLANPIVRFTSLLPASLVKDDHLSIELQPGKGTIISLNGFKMMQVSDEGFFYLLLRTWIGPRPPSSDFKARMLGDTSQRAQDLARQMRASAPSSKRIAEIQSWTRPRIDASIQAQSLPDVATTNTPPPAGPTRSTPSVSIAAEETQLGSGDAMVQATEDEELKILRETYQSMLVQRIYNQLDYPARAMTQGQEGDVMVRARIDRDGQLVRVKVERSSAYPMLNAAATQAIKEASPFPPPPDHIASNESFDFRVPVKFRLPR